MALIILALVIGIPLVEILVFIEVGSEIGALNTVLITVVTAVIGMALLRVQGLGVLMRAQQAIERKEAPVNEIFEGVFLAIAGLFLLIPGFVTDAIGFLLFLPPLRRALASYMAKHSKFAARASYQQGGQRPPGGTGPVIDGEYEVVEDDAPQLNNDPDSQGEGTSKNPDSPWSGKK
ncbi:FxsA family protein [Sneathiella marina]|uniref:FxsA family protein n=1 Tax=Sneathiella marina TaxID=2950108 RepID=A0ABY4W350_9PROT|nr:FxsA family protein [Sneathiella marina]USG61387.1 FxsA family protein [Sneathiella marina]